MRLLVVFVFLAGCSSPESGTNLSDLADAQALPDAPETPDAMPPDDAAPDATPPSPDAYVEVTPPIVPKVHTQVILRDGVPHQGGVTVIVDGDELGEPKAMGEEGKLTLPLPAGGGVIIAAQSVHKSENGERDLRDVFYFVAPPAGTTLVAPTGNGVHEGIGLGLPKGESVRVVLGGIDNAFSGPGASEISAELPVAFLEADGTCDLLVMSFDVGAKAPGAAGYGEAMPEKVALPVLVGEAEFVYGVNIKGASDMGNLVVENEVWGSERLLALLPAGRPDVDQFSVTGLDLKGLAAGTRATLHGDWLGVELDGAKAELRPGTGVANRHDAKPEKIELDPTGLPAVTTFIVAEKAPGTRTLAWNFAGDSGADGIVVQLVWHDGEGRSGVRVRWTVIVPAGVNEVVLPLLPGDLELFHPPPAGKIPLQVGLYAVDNKVIDDYAGFLATWWRPRAPSTGIADLVRFSALPSDFEPRF